MRAQIKRWMVIGISLSLLGSLAFAELKPDKIRIADARKTQTYLKDGMITGGDRAIHSVIVKDIRRAANAEFERIVIDLEGNRNGEPVAIQRPSYYQVSVTPDEKRVVTTLFGNPRLIMDPKKVIASFKKSPAIQGVHLYPVVTDDSWTFSFDLKGESPVEVFELNNPARIIMDIKIKK